MTQPKNAPTQPIVAMQTEVVALVVPKDFANLANKVLTAVDSTIVQRMEAQISSAHKAAINKPVHLVTLASRCRALESNASRQEGAKTTNVLESNAPTHKRAVQRQENAKNAVRIVNAKKIKFVCEGIARH